MARLRLSTSLWRW